MNDGRGRQVLAHELSDRVRRASDEVLVLVLEAFREGRRAGAERVAGKLGRYCASLMSELERQHDALTPERVEQIEAGYGETTSSPIVAAHFGGSAEVPGRVQGELRRLGSRAEGGR